MRARMRACARVSSRTYAQCYVPRAARRACVDTAPCDLMCRANREARTRRHSGANTQRTHVKHTHTHRDARTHRRVQRCVHASTCARILVQTHNNAHADARTHSRVRILAQSCAHVHMQSVCASACAGARLRLSSCATLRASRLAPRRTARLAPHHVASHAAWRQPARAAAHCVAPRGASHVALISRVATRRVTRRVARAVAQRAANCESCVVLARRGSRVLRRAT